MQYVYNNNKTKGEKMEIECIKYTPINKGALLGFANVYVPKWQIEIYGLTLNQKNGKRWVNFPSKDYIDATTNEKKYAPHLRFKERPLMDAFGNFVIKAVDKYCMENNTQAAQVTEDQFELPF